MNVAHETNAPPNPPDPDRGNPGERGDADERWHSVVDHVQDGILTFDEAGILEKFNPAAQQVFGYLPAEVIGKQVTFLLPGLEREIAERAENTRLQNDWGNRIGTRQEVAGRRKDGSTILLELVLTPYRSGGRQFYSGILRDVGGLQRAEQRLRAQYKLARVLADADTEAEAIPQILSAVCRSLDWDYGAFWTRNPGDLRLHLVEVWPGGPLCFPRFTQASWELAPVTGDRTLPGQVASGGRPLWLSDLSGEGHHHRGPIAAEEGLHGAVAFPILGGREVLGVMEFFSHEVREPDPDVLDMMAAVGSQVGHFVRRWRATQAHHRGEEFLRAILRNVHDGIMACDAQGGLTLFNRAAREWYGLADEPLPKDLTPDEMARHYAVYRADGKTPLPGAELPLFRALRGEEVRDTELVIAPAKREARHVLVSGRALTGAGGSTLGAVIFLRDVTEPRRMESQLRQAQKMEAVGRLAGGVAHDFNNLLTIINGYSGILVARLKPDDPAREILGAIHNAGERAATLTRQLLAFSRKQVIEPRFLDLNALVRDMEKLLRHVIGEDVILAVHLAASLGTVKADPGQLEQVLMNLAVNARDAMPQGGRLTVETANVELSAEYCAQHAEVKPGQYVLLAVSDTGLGMSEEVKAHLFEPFFTTKEPGKGTGLGLATIYGIIKQSGGYVCAYSEPGWGTTFKVYLPRVDEIKPASKSNPGLSAQPQGSETILLVEDEDAVRSLTRFLLQSHGYRVLEAADAAAALRAAETFAGPIHILVTDVVMPRVGGRPLAERLTRLRPDLKVLFVSGYTDDAVVRHGILEAEVDFLQKPYTPAALLQKVREVLARGTRS